MEAFITRRGGAGGIDWNFFVTGGTTQPENPKENTIWVNTEIPIERWTLDQVQPGAAAQGDLWIKTNDYSANKVQIGGENSVWSYISYAYQYIDGAWTINEEAYFYQNGAWTQMIPSLYVLSGGKISELAGSWVNATSTEFSDGMIRASTQNSSTGNYGYFSKKIDVSDYDTLTFNVNIRSSTDGLNFFGLASSTIAAGQYATQLPKFVTYVKKPSGSGTLTMNISALTGSYYVAIVAIASFTVDRIVMKKNR